MLQFHNISLALRVWSNSWKWVAIGSSMNRYWKTLNSESSSITKWKSIATIISKLWLRSWSTSWKSSTQTKWSSLNWLFKRPKNTSKNDSSRFIVYIISFREFILNFNFSNTIIFFFYPWLLPWTLLLPSIEIMSTTLPSNVSLKPILKPEVQQPSHNVASVCKAKQMKTIS